MGNPGERNSDEILQQEVAYLDESGRFRRRGSRRSSSPEKSTKSRSISTNNTHDRWLTV
jgi:hypothetical protein